MSAHDCENHGHVWLDAEKQPYARLRGSDLNATIDVHCQHCHTIRALPKYSTFSGPRTVGQPVNHTIPPGILSATERALTDAAKTDPTRRAPKVVKKRAKKKTHGSVPKP